MKICKNATIKLLIIHLPEAKHLHHKLHEQQFDSNNHANFVFHGFIWNRHKCHSFICII
jgi:hypothetical protein